MKNEKERIIAADHMLVSPAARIPFYPLVVKSARGATLTDYDGRQYLDFLSSACIANIGHNHPRVQDAIISQTKELIHYNPAYAYHKPMVDLAAELCRITPGSFPKRVAFGLSGGDANDAAIKIVRSFTGRQKIISFVRSYHGATYGALSLSAVSLNMQRRFGPLLPEIYHIPYPDCYRCIFGRRDTECSLECLEYVRSLFANLIPPEEVAAVIMEPVQGDSGIIVPPQDYVDEFYSLCAEHGILVVAEEVQSGFGRTGQWFAAENFRHEPDLVIMGKAMASGMPLSAVVGRKEILEGWSFPGHALSTSANAVCCAASLATIAVIEEEQLLSKALTNGAYLGEGFKKMAEELEIIGDVRGIGLMLGVDLVLDRKTRERAKKETAKLAWRCWEKGLFLTFFSESVLRIAPPLNITMEEMDRALDIIYTSLTEVLAGKISDDVLDTVKGW